MTKKTYLQLHSSVQYIKGIGPKRAAYLNRIGVETVQDLLFLIPHRYIDYSQVMKIRDLKINDEATILGRVALATAQRTRTRRSMVKVVLIDETGEIVLRWFNRPDLKTKFENGMRLLVSGKVSFYHGAQMINPLFEGIDDKNGDGFNQGKVIPVYPLTEGLTLWDIKRAVTIALRECCSTVPEILPSRLLEKHALMTRRDALFNIHEPKTVEEARCARRRLVYDEFFFFELILAKRRTAIKDTDGIKMIDKGTRTKELLELLPYDLTHDQKQAIQTIARDMAAPRPMNLLLQGDVGSGKTIVALYAMLIAVENGYQAALMAPTEILAEQHSMVLSPLLEKMNVRVALITSSIRAAERRKILGALQQGTTDIVIGTHALIEGDITFNHLGLAIVDEQHRFGVMQRAALVNKGQNPDFLVLSATPIPRTIALTLYGDLDIATIKEKPPGRGDVITKIIRERDKHDAYKFIRDQLALHRQAFVICPIIERSEKFDLKSVQDIHQEITRAFPEFQTGVIHGRLKTPERIAIMETFRSGRIDILVATTVIEVGVDIPNAAIMLIEHPERFGLAQLHQLRGRIGRGAEKAYCFLLVDTYLKEETYERISFFEKNNDGFALAQQDMKLRGPGEILGKRQHGLPDIRIGDLDADREILFKARDDAFDLISIDPQIASSDHAMVHLHLRALAEQEELLRIG
ncbi:ATP-dependent DNA helicase RecG [candidate division WOR-3 bacterium]|nr:ATP-dependent DNA helicase RecG [candidate division WOR-3 bacterium]